MAEAGGPARECLNCGASGAGLKRCSRCHAAWFCSRACQRAYWPFHKAECVRNDFADALEDSEPRFARFVRKHGKMAVLKDDEVDRLERADKAVAGGRSRQEVMESMYGRADPKPLEPAYTAAEVRRMQAAAEVRLAAKEALALDPQRRAWEALDAPAGFGLEAEARGFKWLQNQGEVQVLVKLPPTPPGRAAAAWGKVCVELSERRVRAARGTEVFLEGELFGPIDASESTWVVLDGVLELTLRKKFRRGRGYGGAGQSNASTFWRALLAGAPPEETLPCEHPPSAYYASEWIMDREDRDLEAERRRQRAAARRLRAPGGLAAASLAAPLEAAR